MPGAGRSSCDDIAGCAARQADRGQVGTTDLPGTIVGMPTISSFYGILIRMYFGDHPPPHFHVRYGEHKARFAIATGDQIDGELPARAARLVSEWANLHGDELEENWRRCEQRLPLKAVEPLP